MKSKFFEKKSGNVGSSTEAAQDLNICSESLIKTLDFAAKSFIAESGLLFLYLGTVELHEAYKLIKSFYSSPSEIEGSENRDLVKKVF